MRHHRPVGGAGRRATRRIARSLRPPLPAPTTPVRDLRPRQTHRAASNRDQLRCLPDLLSSTRDRLFLCGRGAGSTYDEPGPAALLRLSGRAQIDAARTGPDGSIRPELAGVCDALTGLERPRSLLTNWHNLASLRTLSDIAAGRLELSHEALDAPPQVFSVTYLRALLIAAGALPRTR